LCLAVGAVAQDGAFGTKASPISSGSSGGGVGIMPILQMVIALGFVLLLLKFVLPKIAGKMNKKLVTSVNSGLQIEESANFAGGTLYIVRARHKTLLLSVNTQGVACLSDLTSEAEVEAEKTTFEKIIDAEPGVQLPDSAVIESALERLERLAV
jgi:flagellar biogenesis protein FliO